MPNRLFNLDYHLTLRPCMHWELGVAMQISSLKAPAYYTVNLCQQPLPAVLVLVNLWTWTQPSHSCFRGHHFVFYLKQFFAVLISSAFLSGVCKVKILTIHPMASTVWHYGNRHGTPRVLSQAWHESEPIVRPEKWLVPRSAVIW